MKNWTKENVLVNLNEYKWITVLLSVQTISGSRDKKIKFSYSVINDKRDI
jgi:hypothetical protein